MMKVKGSLVFVENPNVMSQAALLLLVERLRKSTLAEWFEFREKYLSSRQLVCSFCGKNGLKKEISSLDELPFLATIDHVVPLSKGGAMYDENNLKVACHSCNNGKGSMSLDEYRGVANGRHSVSKTDYAGSNPVTLATL